MDTTRAEEVRFLATIEGGLARFEQLAPRLSTQGSSGLRGTIAGEEAFRLYDTFGFPLDLTDLMARERGYAVDIAGFQRALDVQREQSREERKSRQIGVSAVTDALTSEFAAGKVAEGSRFIGYSTTDVETEAIALVRGYEGGRVAVLLRESPFYAQSGGQMSDTGTVEGDGWQLEVEDVVKVDGRAAPMGRVIGTLAFGRVRATVARARRLDTERNHTATHLLHAALRQVLGEHVHQAGSLVAPDRLRFDFHHHGPLSGEQLAQVEALINDEVWRASAVTSREMPYAEAVATGAMALFGEKYGDRVRVVEVPDFSRELCGGTHVRNTSEIGLFKIAGESGVAAGVRRIEAITGARAHSVLREREAELLRIAVLMRAAPDQAVTRVQALIEQRRQLERQLHEASHGDAGTSRVDALIAGSREFEGVRIISAEVQSDDVRALQAMGDLVRERLQNGVAVLASTFADGKTSLLVVVSDSLRERGVRADALVREISAVVGGRGGGKAHMAQAGLPDAARVGDALDNVDAIVRQHLTVAA